MITDERVKAEHDYIERSRAMAPAMEHLNSWLALEMQDLAKQIMRAGSDDERREIAADMNAVDRLSRRLDEMTRRGDEAKKNLEKWSSTNA